MKTWVLLLMVITASCTGVKKTMDTDIEAIKFGSGGGVTGAANIFILKQDGTLAKEMRNRQPEVLGTIEKDKTNDLFKKADNIKNYVYDRPGNMYSFIELVKASGSNNIVWAAPADVDTNVIKFYKELSQLSNSLNK